MSAIRSKELPPRSRRARLLTALLAMMWLIWVGSYWLAAEARLDGARLIFIAQCADGEITTFHRTYPFARDDSSGWHFGFGRDLGIDFKTFVSQSSLFKDTAINFAGLIVGGAQFPLGSGGMVRERIIAIPIWPIVLITAVPAIFAHRRRVVWLRRSRRGLCVACGYDLRESSDRCPECGKPIESSHSANTN